MALLGFFLSLGPPYVMVGLVLGRLIASSTLCIVFSLSLCLAVGSLSAMLLFMLCHVKRRTADHASYDVDVVIEIKVGLGVCVCMYVFACARLSLYVCVCVLTSSLRSRLG